eukprot:CAMPEP_0201637166 /NCGR_PEP_ID=MMETSP0493-20130528/11151_1 /ASSEMBLY_ACC=CAM_ASM_000838 /TAXON_ID=420259 /ORGANISM="Thalassiosira gravida, Strain GMp14c1" /LENGTH=67 /DNA_ID=CAMNT_0048109577 /DNA_START=416 /DNA_END=619 /DNA_ORIENTATION=-
MTRNKQHRTHDLKPLPATPVPAPKAEPKPSPDPAHVAHKPVVESTILSPSTSALEIKSGARDKQAFV